MQQLEQCKKCLNREISRSKGILCGLTHAKPTFDAVCPDYKVDQAQVKRMGRFERNVNKSEVAKVDGYKFLTIGLPAFVIGILIMIMYGTVKISSIFQLFALIAVILGALFIVFGILKLIQAYGDPKSDDSELDEIDLL